MKKIKAMAENDPRQQLLSSIRRIVQPTPSPLFTIFDSARNMRFHLLDNNNVRRIRLINDVFGIETGGEGLSWDTIAACRDQETVAEWLDREIADQTSFILQTDHTSDVDQLLAEISDAIALSRIEAPRTIFHVAALHANIPIYKLFVKYNFPGQDEKYDSSLINHQLNGLLPYELARNVDPAGIGAFAVDCYNTLLNSTDEEDV
jgi:hypothetical protein